MRAGRKARVRVRRFLTATGRVISAGRVHPWRFVETNTSSPFVLGCARSRHTGKRVCESLTILRLLSALSHTLLTNLKKSNHWLTSASRFRNGLSHRQQLVCRAMTSEKRTRRPSQLLYSCANKSLMQLRGSTLATNVLEHARGLLSVHVHRTTALKPAFSKNNDNERSFESLDFSAFRGEVNAAVLGRHIGCKQASKERSHDD